MDSTSRYKIAIFLLLIVAMIKVNGHGRLMEPPARNSMWRVGFNTPRNWNDNELFCGGFTVQHVKNKGKCGICGDPYHVKQPRPHEAGGTYATGTIVRRYVQGQKIDVEVELTANHQGEFVFYICPNDDPSREVTQECLEKFPLSLVGTTDTRFFIPPNTPRRKIFRYGLVLPPDVTCSHCVIQWNYYAANMWGRCPNGTEKQGCGKAELFRNCADVSIVTNTGGGLPAPINFRALPTFIRAQVCVPTDFARPIPGIEGWCQTNCFNVPPFCPEGLCQCPDICDAIGDIAGQEGADVYCQDKCIVYPSKCPEDRCSCREVDDSVLYLLK